MFQQLLQWWRPSRRVAGEAQAHLTFGQTSVGASISRVGLLLKRQMWIWPMIALLLLGSVGWGVRSAIERTMKANVQSELETVLRLERSMLEKWLKIQESSALTIANNQQVRRLVAELTSTSSPVATRSEASTGGARLAETDSVAARLGKELEPAMSALGFVGYVVTDKTQRIVAAYTQELVGTTVPQYEAVLSRALDGTPTVSPPFPSIVMLKDKSGRLRSGVPTMFAAAPVRDENLQVVAVLALRIQPEKEFTSILQLGQMGASGETYAFNKQGTMVSNSRFDEELMLLGLLPDTEGSQSILNISLRDPGGDLTAGYRPRVRRAELPLCRSVAEALAGNNGTDVTGHRSYRGSPVVASWTWLPQYDLGIVTEYHFDEAFRPLFILKWTFYALLGLLATSSVAIFVFTLLVAQWRREAQRAALEAKHLGQYRLEEKLGAGAMGVVYRGHHAMLRRPTAIKMLHADRANDATIERFEREVQITCRLNNPNTVAIYDYGRTPEGVFYYAMEYLDGIDLQKLVEQYGPQPEGRVIHVLRQVCDSLFEAHSLGLVHRDIKPANVMLNRRGGLPDVVKVLDFGLVKALDEARQSRESGGLAGTPLYMSPEAIQTPGLVDARSDLYAVGALGYFLITGQPVFAATSLVDLCQLHATGVPEAPSQRLGRPVSPELESALLACLAKNRAHRPQTARDLRALLDRASSAAAWSVEEADAWWGRHDRRQSSGSGPPASIHADTQATLGLAQTMDR